MRKAAALGLAVVVQLFGCGRGGTAGGAPSRHDDAGTARDAPAASALPDLPLGVPELASYGYRKRPGQPAFRTAQAAQARGDWAAAVTACREALARDPGHLDAAWLLAIALCKSGDREALVAPLARAVAGDPQRWALASLDQPALQPFLETPTGQAWRRRIDELRRAYVTVLAHALVVRANGELYAYDPEAPRWYRLTRTGGAVSAAFAASKVHQLAYLTRERGRAPDEVVHRVGLVDLALGTTTPAERLPAGPVSRLTWGRRKPGGFVVLVGSTWELLHTDGTLHVVSAADHPSYPAYLVDEAVLELAGHSPDLHRRVTGVDADWDARGLASAIRIGASNRVVSVPSPGLIDGNTVTWSPDRAHLALVARVSEACLPDESGTAAYVVDVATGSVRELGRANGGIAIEWLDDRRLALANDHGVEIVALGGGKSIAVPGATGLVTPKRLPRCAGEPGPPPPAEPDDVGDPPASDVGSGSAHDAGVEPDATPAR